MQRRTPVDTEAEKDRKLARKRARRESLRAATEQSRSMTSDFNSAFGRPSLFTAGSAITNFR